MKSTRKWLMIIKFLMQPDVAERINENVRENVCSLHITFLRDNPFFLTRLEACNSFTLILIPLAMVMGPAVVNASKRSWPS